MASAPAAGADAPGFSSYQKLVIALIAFLQFTLILDFMVLSPLGAIIIPALRITPAQFGLLVSVYAFSAGASGVLAAGFTDRFDRKRLLLFFYSGFVLGTLLCALARSYEALLFARMITGVFGGVIGSIVFAITTDLFEYQVRGRVMGVVQTAFAASNVLGIPLALFLSNRWGWNAPFMLIVGASTLVGVVIVFKLKPINAHLARAPDRSALHHLLHTVTMPRYLQGFATTGLLSVGGFMLMPFMSAFTVHNLGVSVHQLPMLYMVTGICSIIAGPLIGRAADAYGKFRVFAFGCATTILMVTTYTHLGVSPLALIIVISVMLFVGVSSRMITASALMSAVPYPADRGSYMAISSSLQQFAGGVAAAVAGLIVVQSNDGHLLHFDVVGYLLTATTLMCLGMMYLIQRRIEAEQRGSSEQRGADGSVRVSAAAGAGTLENPPPLAVD
ncbi:MAG: MFS transporter [Steroidobacteraceae bacterium]